MSDTKLDIEAAQRAIDATETVNGLKFEGNNYKITQLFSLREHLIAALSALDTVSNRPRQVRAITCWSCQHSVTIAAIRENDGDCPACNAEIDCEQNQLEAYGHALECIAELPGERVDECASVARTALEDYR